MAQTILVTGASSGIGAAIATRLATRGDRVFGTSRSGEAGPHGPTDKRIGWLPLDVGSEASIDAAVKQIAADTGAIDALVHCAGFGIFGSVEEVSIEQAQRQLDTNFTGVLRVLRAVLPRMRARRAGCVLLVGSLAGRAPIPFQAHYSASKAAVDALAQSLYNELHPFGVSVSLIEPGDINTPFNDAMDWGDAKSASAYGEAIARTERSIRENLPKAPPPELVASVVEKALDSKRRRFRYPVGNEALLVGLGKRLVGDRLSLRLIRDHFGLSSAS